MYISYLCPLWALSSALLSDSAAAAAIGFINGIGSIGGFLGPFFIGYLRHRTGTFTLSLVFMMLTFAAGAVTVLLCPDPRRAGSFAG
jgi:ACS family tartrate transporter-like MFS transporter